MRQHLTGTAECRAFLACTRISHRQQLLHCEWVTDDLLGELPNLLLLLLLGSDRLWVRLLLLLLLWYLSLLMVWYCPRLLSCCLLSYW